MGHDSLSCVLEGVLMCVTWRCRAKRGNLGSARVTGYNGCLTELCHGSVC